MESSPLVLAHDHARAAVVATQSADTTVAINEHALAAGEFAKAAKGTGSAEALRTLRLLEAHHLRISELLRYPAEHPVTANSNEPEVKSIAEKPLSTSAAVAELRASKSDLGPRVYTPLRNPPSLSTPRRLPPRDLSSSIASNLASARGIRSNHTRQPLSPSLSLSQAPSNIDGRRDSTVRSKVPSIPEHSAPRPSWVPPQPTQKKSEPQTSTSRASAIAEPSSPPPTPTDEGFSRFYNALNSAVSRFSAPLAFAAIPIPLFSTDDSNTAKAPSPTITHSQPNSKPQTKDHPPVEDSAPDLTKLISKAAVRASTRDNHIINDSFYVVPSTGHTASYAHILSFDEKERRRLAASMHSADPEDDDFVDAKESLPSISPSKSHKNKPANLNINRRSAGRNPGTRNEELELENAELKGVIDKMSKRLHAFELAAQNSSLALRESMRMMRPEDREGGDRGREKEREREREREKERERENAEMKLQIKDLQDQVKSQNRDIERLQRENEKLRVYVDRYRSRWDMLKAGAKSRREGGSSTSKEGAGAASREGSVNGGGAGDNGAGATGKEGREGGRFLAG
ncbi:hypothetical protein CJF32_00010045 [Rutstroemia sp. NJR-2017a WRK4]|nr:hypothetical protein CJF32_00010045 [Rutstroemia sp. NJR-2017a WRK4]